MLSFKNTYFFLLSRFITIIFLLTLSNSRAQNGSKDLILPGADQTEKYLHLLKGKNVAIVANQTSVIFKGVSSMKKEESDNNNGEGLYTHLIDSLILLGVNIKKVFAPEHGFRGKADAGEHVSSNTDEKTGLAIISLFGKNKKPDLETLSNIDLVLFDIQDVGVRFYTYISTMSYLMEACAELEIPMMIFDRPNPNGHYIDGPTLEIEHRSFVGMHPIPLVYGMTIGEYAKMVNGEKWLKDGLQCDITIISLKNYSHKSEYNLPIRPSPNLPNAKSINLYPSLGFFEGTIINAGRGTEHQFQRYGAPFFPKTDFNYTPQPNFGSKHPKFDGKLCYGIDLHNTPKLKKVNLEYLIDAYHKTPKDKDFFGKTFTIHAGTLKLREQIEAGLNAKEIRAGWQSDIKKFQKVRTKYLIYK